MFLFECQDGDHSVTRITEARIRYAISDRAGFVDVRLIGQNKRRDLAAASGEGSSININQIDPIIFAVDWLREDRY